MHSAHGTAHGIVEQQNTAVGGKDRQGKTGLLGNEGVGGVVPLTQQPLAGIVGGAETHGGLMHLLAQYGTRRRCADGRAEAAVIFHETRRAVPPAGAQVQTVPGGGGNAAAPGGKAVADAGEQRRSQENKASLRMGLE